MNINKLTFMYWINALNFNKEKQLEEEEISSSFSLNQFVCCVYLILFFKAYIRMNLRVYNFSQPTENIHNNKASEGRVDRNLSK